MYNPKTKKGRDPSSPTKKPTCGKCGKKHYGDCLKRKDNCFGCGKSGHKIRACPNVRGKDKGRSLLINPIIFPNRVFYVELLELNMLDFDVILGMDWLHICVASIDCRTRVVKFNFPNEPVLDWKGEIYS